MVLLGVLAVLLRRRSVILEQEQQLFGRFITELILPALIFVSLAHKPVTFSELHLALIMFCMLAFAMAIAWGLGTAMRLSPPVLGSFILVSSIGSTSTLGYTIVRSVYPDSPIIMSKVVVMGEIGVILPLFTVGVLIANYFGKPNDRQSARRVILRFFRSPIFIATVLGFFYGHLELADSSWITLLLHAVLNAIIQSLDMFVAFAVGLMIKPVPIRSLLFLILAAASLKLVLLPLTAFTISDVYLSDEVEQQLLIIMAAMPSGTIAAVVAARHGCDAAVASSLVAATYLLCLVSLPIVLAIFL